MRYLLILLWGISIWSCKEVSKRDISTREPIGCATPVNDIAWYDTDNKPPLLQGLDVLDLPISTDNAEAKKYVEQGLVLAYGFNHAEAARSFYYASKLDPDCAMAYWGFALVLGPNINAVMEEANYNRAYTAIQKARALKHKTQAWEQGLIEALLQRYTPEPVIDRAQLDQNYAHAMKALFNQFPGNPHIGTMYAEALMDLHPWDLWLKDGQPQAWTPKILNVLEQVLAWDPRYPGAHHLYIHAVEASKQPEKGWNSAQMFDKDLVPGAGHLVHMPSHIYIRTGDYHLGTLANERAIATDNEYFTACHAQGIYPLAYFPHKHHFLAATAALEGAGEKALIAAQNVARYSNKQLMKQAGWGTLQHYYTIPYNIMVKFGKWDDILALENPYPNLPYIQAIRHYARGMAFWGKGNLNLAHKELAMLKSISEDSRLAEITIWDINTVQQLTQIASLILEAELMASNGNWEKAIRLLTQAIALEDALNYNEPPDWFFSVRHHLGAIQLDAGWFENAVETYTEDLKRLPKNGWALHGLKAAYRGLKDTEKERLIEEELAQVWAHADISLNSSRIK
ncbi:tetratricopeptide repeat protein [Sediminicola luteus]|uniref:Uncharacterized protein n=1 Tax=Sediminicola luteus TaxID=319238 RepID=A0A2A4GE53_9FLAO|nr:hypothetical protein [Sediminicola luteus]PCE66691.1 hypothetical protein B7P33_05210 [Sediminicola luteus]